MFVAPAIVFVAMVNGSNGFLSIVVALTLLQVILKSTFQVHNPRVIVYTSLYIAGYGSTLYMGIDMVFCTLYRKFTSCFYIQVFK